MTEARQPDGEPRRKRPIGGAAAWRRVEEPPLRAAHDDAPERTRYRRATVGEQAREAWEGFVHNRALVLVVVALVGGWLVLRATTPTPVTLAELKPGDCLYVRPSDPDVGPPVGAPGDVQARLAADGAEYASCTLTHSHEVVAVVPLEGAGPWPGASALRDAARATCEAAFLALPSASRGALTPLTVVPDEAGWAAGVRSAACLVHRSDRAYLDRPVR